MAAPMPELAGVEHRYAEINGFRMHYAEAGDGEPLILQHGWPQHWWMWRNQIPAFAERYRVIVPDLRGHGWSDAPRRGYEKRQFAADVIALMDELGIERARYVGHDWGAVAGYHLGTAHAERFERIACLGAPPPWRKMPPQPDLVAVTVLYQGILAAPVVGGLAVRNGFPELVMKAGRELGEFSEEELAAYRGPLREPGHDNASVQTYRVALTKELPAGLRDGNRDMHVSVPLLVVLGGEEMFRKLLDPERIREHAPDPRIELIPGSGHFMPEEAPDTVNELLLEFLEG
jgi:pimeloyl-ACP methyl ester carboxylesterase